MAAFKSNLVAMTLAVTLLAAITMAYNVQDPQEEDYYALALANLLRQRQAAMAMNGNGLGGPHMVGPAEEGVPMDKRACARRGSTCAGLGSKDCCEGNMCRCNLFGSNCRCQRTGLLQSLM
ncbi:hypothetical protein HDE_00594 [Halotydeus destructor]|nr:hypothetical protein HDE_00594 [Halotydeus destructor]